MNWIVTQLGSRQHYVVPRAFHARNHLHRFYTDLWWPASLQFFRELPGPLAALATRRHPDLPPEKVTAFNSWTLAKRFSELIKPPSSFAAQYENYISIGQEFARRVNQHLNKTPPSQFQSTQSAAFLFSTGALETCHLMRDWRIPILVDQIDPARVEERLIKEEIEKWPGWQPVPGTVPESYYQRLSEEWNLADIVLVNSNWTRSSLIEQGVPAQKIAVVPISFSPKANAQPKIPTPANAPLTILWLGQIILRKGIQYLFEAARQLASANVRFIVGGHMGISPEKIAAAPPNVQVVGRVLKHNAADYYRQADVFILPTISDGFAITQLEALSAGVPVITTPNCGEVVTDQVDGLIIPPANTDAIVQAILKLDRDRDLLNQMSKNAIKKPQEHRFTPDGYADAVEAAMASIARP